MRTIRRSSAFKRDLRRVVANPRYKDAARLLQAVVDALAADNPLPAANRDHVLSGDWITYRECHVRPDLLLIYRKPDADTLHLARLGSHSDLFG
ncbi:MAG: type II toxin-antitoxin system YafQ family toxin [Acetobacteraceae bacterium]